ncbi:MAG: hypothetical protein WHV63_01720 [Ignavibacteria bacterium]|nr:hypothetical protein [Ignavibacteria bacterium]
MKNQKEELLTVGKIAEQLSVPAAKVKKAIQELGIQPTAKKGACSYFSKSDVPKIKKALTAK